MSYAIDELRRWDTGGVGESRIVLSDGREATGMRAIDRAAGPLDHR